METQTYQASDGATLHYRQWRPEQAVAVVVSLHGIQSHSGWFVDSCEHLSRHGCRVLSLDRRGSGMNEEARGHAPGYKVLVEDVRAIVEQVRAEEPDLPLHVLGVCWGGKLAVCLAGMHPGLVDSVILSSPALAAKVRPGAAVCVLIGLCSLLRPRRLFKIPIDRAEMFTANPERIEFINNDPARLDLATARLLAESKRLDWVVKKVASRVTAPALMMLSGRDEIVDNDGTTAVFHHFGSPEKRIERFEEATHLLEFESDNTEYLDTLTAWIKEHC